MGSCSSKITITEDMFLTLKSNPNDKLLLSLCLHYDIYDQKSQSKIDELCQLSLTTDKGVNIFLGSADNKVAALQNSAEKNNLSIE
jgi:hypothetical protein